MAVLVYGEHTEGKFKKATFEAATFGAKLGAKFDLDVHAVVLGKVEEEEIKKLGQYGVSKVHHSSDDIFDRFEYGAFADAIIAAAKGCDTKHIVLAQSYNGRALAPRISVKYEAALLSGIKTLPEDGGAGVQVKRVVFSNKGIQTLSTGNDKVVYTLQGNAFQPEEQPTEVSIESFSPEVSKTEGYEVKEVQRRTDKVSLTEADVVVSAGRGLKGPENWDMVEELADLLGAATACSKPVADIEWRPHHEHVGQTGIQISPNVYIAIGISGAIQHLAGVSASKTIIVINKDPEAPFFKAADFGIVGDAFEVVPKLIDAVKAKKS